MIVQPSIPRQNQLNITDKPLNQHRFNVEQLAKLNNLCLCEACNCGKTFLLGRHQCPIPNNKQDGKYQNYFKDFDVAVHPQLAKTQTKTNFKKTQVQTTYFDDFKKAAERPPKAIPQLLQPKLHYPMYENTQSKNSYCEKDPHYKINKKLQIKNRDVMMFKQQKLHLPKLNTQEETQNFHVYKPLAHQALKKPVYQVKNYTELKPMPFEAPTTYAQKFPAPTKLGFPHQPPVKLEPKQPFKVPFEGKTSYGDQFYPKNLAEKGKPQSEQKNQKHINLFGGKFEGDTTYRNDYMKVPMQIRMLKETCPIQQIGMPTYNPTQKQHLRFNLQTQKFS